MFLVPLAVLTTWPTRPTCLDVATSAETCAALAMWGCEGDLAAPVRANCCVCGGGVFGLLLPWDVSLRSELGASSGEGIDAPPGGAVHLRVPALMDVWRVRGPCPPTFSRLADGGGRLIYGSPQPAVVDITPSHRGVYCFANSQNYYHMHVTIRFGHLYPAPPPSPMPSSPPLPPRRPPTPARAAGRAPRRTR